MIVLDASLMIEWLLGDERESIAQHVYDSLPDVPIHVPSIWPVEVGNALRSQLRGGALSIEKIHALLDTLGEFDIQIDAPVSIDEIGPLAQFASAYSLTVYDATYVQLALRRNLVLATVDRDMRAAAQRLDIPLLPA